MGLSFFSEFIPHAGWHSMLFCEIIIINIRGGPILTNRILHVHVAPFTITVLDNDTKPISKTNDPTIVIVHGHLRCAQCQKYVACLGNLINLIILLSNNASECTSNSSLSHSAAIFTWHSKAQMIIYERVCSN